MNDPGTEMPWGGPTAGGPDRAGRAAPGPPEGCSAGAGAVPRPEGLGAARGAPGGPRTSEATLFARRRLRVLYLAGVSIAFLLLAFRLRDVLNPFLVALLIAYILNPAADFLERRMRLPRSVAITLIFLVIAGGAGAVITYSVGQTTHGLGRLMMRAAGGWQLVPSAVTATALPVAPAEPAPGAAAAGAHLPGAPARIESSPVYGDDLIVAMPDSTILGFLDLNRNERVDPSEPILERAESGAWRLTPSFAAAGWIRTPGYLDQIQTRLAREYAGHRQMIDSIVERLKANAASVAEAGAQVWNWLAGQLFSGIFTVVAYFVLVPIYTFFLLLGFDRIVRRIEEYLPGRHRVRIASIASRIDRACAAFFRGRFLVCVGKAVSTWIGLWLVGVEFSFTIGVIVGALSIIPIVGPIVGFALSIVFSYGPEGWLARILGALAVLVAVEIAEAVANPVVLGREVGLHPVTILIALFIFGDLFGLFGILLAIPLAAIAKILGEEFVLPELRLLAAETPDRQVSGFFQAWRES